MHDQKVNYWNILVPIILAFLLMIISVSLHPIILTKLKWYLLLILGIILGYLPLWVIISPDSYSRNSGLLIGALFMINISMEEFFVWTFKNGNLVSTLIIMAIIFVSFSIISGVKTHETQKIIYGIKSSLISALLGTLIAINFGFAIDFIFLNKITNGLQGYPGFNTFDSPEAFTFYNSFDNALSHLIIAPLISIIMGASGGVIALGILKQQKKSQNLD